MGRVAAALLALRPPERGRGSLALGDEVARDADHGVDYPAAAEAGAAPASKSKYPTAGGSTGPGNRLAGDRDQTLAVDYAAGQDIDAMSCPVLPCATLVLGSYSVLNTGGVDINWRHVKMLTQIPGDTTFQ